MNDGFLILKLGNHMKFNMQEILQQAQKMQSDMEQVKNEIDRKTVSAESGGGMVSVTMTGGFKVLSIKIAKELVNPDDIQMLEDLVVAAVNKASESARDMAAAEMRKAAPMLPNIPGFNLGL